MKTFLLFTAFLQFLFIAAQNPIADFTVNKTIGCNPLSVEFLNSSQNSSSYFWDFGDGNTATSSNPTHIFYTPGTFSVSLIAFSTTGSSDTLVIPNLIVVDTMPVSNFSIPDNIACENNNAISFINNSSNSTASFWDFGDGSTSTLSNPVHTYTSPGVFTIVHIAQNSSGCSDLSVLPNYVIISPQPTISFSVDTTKSCKLDYDFSFTGNPANMSTYSWNFGDGNSSILQNPLHQYSSPGTYSVSLQVSNQYGCSSALTKTNYINVSQELSPVFSVDKNSGCAPLTVNFNNTMGGQQLTYSWNFGDGGVSSTSNPTYTYTDTGIYSVTLTVKDIRNCAYSFFSDSIINTNDPLMAGFTADTMQGCAPLEISFTNLSSNASSFTWDFGDGTISNQQNPLHIYSTPGKYSVSLEVSDSNNCKSIIQKANLITILGPVADFAVNDTSGCAPVTFSFSDSSANAVHWVWDFGDGTTSVLENPSHLYNNGGIYSISLITTDANGCKDTLVKNNLINAYSSSVSFSNTVPVFSCGPVSASFNGSAIGKNFFLWDFGDGEVSTLPDPFHTFSAPGMYHVSLTTQTMHGCTVTISNYNSYEIASNSTGFITTTDTCPGYLATFTDTSSDAVAWHWDFGDSATSSLQNPSHSYASPGFYNVSLTITTSQGCIFSILKTNTVKFSACGNDTNATGGIGMGGNTGTGGSDSLAINNAITGCAPFKVLFTNPVDSAISFYWNFGDGNFSTLPNAFHTYSTSGIYDVYLAVQYSNQQWDTIFWNSFISVNAVNAGFSVLQNNGCNFGNIQISDTSINATAWNWEFGDGTVSTIQNPSYNYPSSGNYLIYLQASDINGCSSIATKNIFAGTPSPVFEYDDTVCVNDTVIFLSNLDFFQAYSWDFGDASGSYEENPSHVYNAGGTYFVTLVANDYNGCSINHSLPFPVTVLQPVASFTLSSQNGCNSLNTSFTNLSGEAISWIWDFGDGSTSVLENPSHNFINPGVYQVSLIAENNGCTDKFISPQLITIYESKAEFSFTQDHLCLPVTASFSDSSLNAISWLWNFGDGSTDTTPNPTHIFTTKPSGNITLTIIDSNGCSVTRTKANINVFLSAFTANVTKGCDSLTVNFQNNSAGAVSWNWNFGDGASSVSGNPPHLYSDSGTYSVTLIAESPDGCMDTTTFPDFIHVYKVIADFSSTSIISGCNPLPVSFLDNSTNATKWKWNFGDGGTSDLVNPFHIYTFPSTYDVSLVASNSAGCTDTILKPAFVIVTGPVASFTLNEDSGCSPLTIIPSDSSFNGAHFYTWYFSDGDSSHAQNPSHQFDSSGIFNISLLVEDSSGCSSYFLFPEDIVVIQSPLAEFNLSATEGCQPLTVNATAITQFSDSSVWNFGFGNQANSSAIYNSPGAFEPFYIAFNESGCSDTFFLDSILVHPSPVADFTADTTEGCLPLHVNFSNLSENLSSAGFTWNFGNGAPEDTSANPEAVYSLGGFFDVMLIVRNESGCSDTSIKNHFIHTFDDYPPAPSHVKVVTVISDTSVYILWEKSRSEDFQKYILYRKNTFSQEYLPVAEFSDIDIISFLDMGLNTLKYPYCYKLQTADFCNNSVAISNLDENCTMNVTALPDSSVINVSWTPYKGCTISAYLVYRLKIGNANFELLADVDRNTLSFEDTTWDCSSVYAYKIKALDLCGNQISSHSDTSAAKVDENIFSLQKSHIIRATVIDNSSVFLEWKAPEFAPEKVTGYTILRSPANLQFEPIATVPGIATSFLDTGANVSEQNYFYKIEPVNSCLVKTQLSNNSSSILLQTERKSYEVKLKWTPYRFWENGVDYYLIEKKDEHGNWKTLKKVPGDITEEKELLIE